MTVGVEHDAMTTYLTVATRLLNKMGSAVLGSTMHRVLMLISFVGIRAYAGLARQNRTGEVKDSRL